MMSPEDSWVSKWQRVSKWLSYPGPCSVESVPKGLQGCLKSAGCVVPCEKDGGREKPSLGTGKMAQQHQTSQLESALGDSHVGRRELTADCLLTSICAPWNVLYHSHAPYLSSIFDLILHWFSVLTHSHFNFLSSSGNFKPGVYAVSVTGRLPQGNSCNSSSGHLPGPAEASVPVALCLDLR